MRYSILLLGLAFGLFVNNADAQKLKRWQQSVEYKMDIDFNVDAHRFNGTQSIKYDNNSPDTIVKVFYHLFYNAFQPGSMMDVRSRTIEDPDGRVGSRILHLKDNEIGYHKIRSLKQDGKKLAYEVVGTILEVELKKPILPGKTTLFEMEFESQVPVQVRRTGRRNKEGVEYSMTQWFPKMCEYDQDGWHANPYVGREFHGVWGSFDVKITIDSSYVIGGTGYLQNPQEIGHGYEMKGKPVKRADSPRLTWHFYADKVHDFAWAADPDFAHDIVTLNDQTDIHFFYQTDTLVENWKRLQESTVNCFKYMNGNYGKYPYKQYSVIQGGDGGMEYPMCTLIAGWQGYGGLLSVTVHESIHSWYQGVLAFNEAKYPWMDEGFTTYAQYVVLDYLYKKNRLNPLARAYSSYNALAHTNKQEPMTTHGDHYMRNRTYGVSTYLKGAIFLYQLSYIVGEEDFKKGMKRFFYEWGFQHPGPDDFKRVMELTSGLELDWYFEQFVQTTNTIDYGIKDVVSDGKKTTVTLEKVEEIPMPLDVVVKLNNGKQLTYYIPLRIMRGQKDDSSFKGDLVSMEAWPWTYPEYNLEIGYSLEEIKSIEIDPSTKMADINRENNVFPRAADHKFFGKQKN